MKKALFLLATTFLLLLGYKANAQLTASDTVYLTSSEIKKMMDDKYYVRVPSNDLDRHLQETVSSVVNNKFSVIYNIIGFAVIIIGGVLAFALRSYVGTEVKKQMHDEVMEIDKNATNNFNQMEKILDLKIKDYFNENFKLNMDNAFVALKKEQEDFFKREWKHLSEIRLERLRSNVEERKDLQKTMEGLKELLTTAEANDDAELLTKVLDELSYVCFYLRKDAELERILDAYIDRTDVEIKETALVNVALVILYDYQISGDKDRRNKAIKYLNRAIRKLPDYGEALGLKLELFMVDYDFATNKERQDEVLAEGKKLIKYISSKEIAAYETLNRLNRVQASAAKSKYIDLIYELYPDEMKVMEEIANKYKAGLDTNLLSAKAN